jgi:hypothetical protein
MMHGAALLPRHTSTFRGHLPDIHKPSQKRIFTHNPHIDSSRRDPQEESDATITHSGKPELGFSPEEPKPLVTGRGNRLLSDVSND